MYFSRRILIIVTLLQHQMGSKRSPRKANLQTSEEEHDHDAESSPAAHGKFRDFSYGENNDDQVKHDVHSSRRPSISVQVDACPMMLAIPVLPSDMDRKTLKTSRCDESDNVKNAKHYRYIDSSPQPLLRKDA